MFHTVSDLQYTDIDLQRGPQAGDPVLQKMKGGSQTLTVGDIHANPLRLLYHFVQAGIIKLPAEEVWEELYIFYEWMAYTKQRMKVHAEESKEGRYSITRVCSKTNYDKIKNRYEAFRQLFEDIIEQLEAGDNCTGDTQNVLRLIGDTDCDRGVDDRLIDALYKKVKSLGGEYKELFSNHKLCRINAEQYLFDMNYQSAWIYAYEKQGAPSSLLSKDERKAIIQEAIANDNLVLINYEQESNGDLIIYTHAPNAYGGGIGVIYDLATSLGIKWEISEGSRVTVDIVKSKIDTINLKFKELACDQYECFDMDSQNFNKTISNFVWARFDKDYNDSSNLWITAHPLDDNTTVKLIFGHDSCAGSLDCSVGQPGKDAGNIPFVISSKAQSVPALTPATSTAVRCGK